MEKEEKILSLYADSIMGLQDLTVLKSNRIWGSYYRINLSYGLRITDLRMMFWLQLQHQKDRPWSFWAVSLLSTILLMASLCGQMA